MRFLVMSGGASKGAYCAGAIKYLVNDLNLKYAGYTGVSVGALNASILSMFQCEKEASETLINIWKSIETKNVRKNWLPFFVISGLWKKSIYNSKPLIDLVHSKLDLNKIRSSGKKISVGAVSLTTGNYKAFTQDDDCFVDAVLASSSFPIGLNPIKIGEELYTDGGVKHILPLKEAISMGATDIDVVVCSPRETTSPFDDCNSITLGMRCFDLSTDQNIEADIKMAKLYNRLISAGAEKDKRYININIIRPKQDLGVSPLTFDHNEIVKMIDIGYQDAKEQYHSIKIGE